MPHSVTPLFSEHEVQFLKKYLDGSRLKKYWLIGGHCRRHFCGGPIDDNSGQLRVSTNGDNRDPDPNNVSPSSSLIKNNASEKRRDRREGLLDRGKRVSRDR